MTPRTTYELHAGSLGPAELRVQRIAGSEGMSQTYRFEIQLLCPDVDRDLERELLGATARLAIAAEPPRVFHGVISEVELLGVTYHEQQQHARHRMVLVPRLWLLSQQRGSRVFQGMTICEIVRQVLDEAQIPSCWLLKHEYPKRELCIQYEETDLELVERLLAESGIYYFFEQPPWEPSLANDVLGPLGHALGGVGGGVGGALGGPVGGALGQAANAIGGVTGLVTDEIAVFADDALFYPTTREVPSVLAGALGSQVEQIASSALGGLAPEVGGLVGDALDVLRRQLDGLAPGGTTAFGYRPNADALTVADTDIITSLTMRGSVRPIAAAFRDFDPRRPRAPLASSHRASPESLGGVLGQLSETLIGLAGSTAGQLGGAVGEVATAAGNALGSLGGPVAGAVGEVAGALGQLAGQSPVRTLEVYEHHTPFLFPSWKHEENEARRMLEGERRDTRLATGQSPCPHLASGHRFQLRDHPIERLNADYVVIEVEHRGHGFEHAGAQGEAIYENTFRCVPAQVPFLPARRRRRTVQTCLTATVVTPSDEVHTAEDAMIKVKFHWDRRGLGYDTTCWIRTMQPWAGAGWGTQFIPRAGMEVVVGFDGGDVDKPIVLGCVYNGIHPPPFPLPGDKTRSGIRTHSTPGANGNNELSFEDASGAEQIYVHAERNLDFVVEHDRSLEVHRHDDNVIAGNQSLRVRQEQRVDVEGGRWLTVTPQDCIEVRGQQTVTIRGNRDQTILADDSLRVTGARREELGGSLLRQLGGDSSEQIAGNHTTLVGSHDAPRSRMVRVEGSSEISASAANTISSEQEVVLRCGASFIRIAEDRIEICAPDVRAQGEGARIRLAEDEARIFASSRLQGVADNVMLKSSGAALGLTSEAAVDGSRVLLNSPQNAQDPAQDEPHEPTIIELVDDEGRACAYQPFRIELEDGSQVTGVLDRNGRAEVDLESAGTISFPGLSEVEAS